MEVGIICVAVAGIYGATENSRINENEKNILITLGVFIVSTLSVFFLPISEEYKGIVSLPGIVALFGFLFQPLRDEIQFKKNRTLQQAQNEFTISISSHMANVAFDKHVLFCEEYISAINNGMPKLFTDGPSASSGDVAEDLKKVRLKYATWVTKEIKDQLLPFEEALSKVDLNHLIIKNIPKGDRKNKLIDEMFSVFSDILELQREKYKTKEKVKGIGFSRIIERVQDVLGITELTKLRIKVIKEANRAVNAAPITVL